MTSPIKSSYTNKNCLIENLMEEIKHVESWHHMFEWREVSIRLTYLFRESSFRIGNQTKWLFFQIWYDINEEFSTEFQYQIIQNFQLGVVQKIRQFV